MSDDEPEMDSLESNVYALMDERDELRRKVAELSRTRKERFRVGRSLGRTIYRVVGDEASKEDVFMGLMDTREWADTVVAALNASGSEE